MSRIGGFSEGDAIRIGKAVRILEKGGLEHPFHRGRWPVFDPSDDQIPFGECDCCPGVVCYFDENDLTDECDAVPCLFQNYTILAAFPYQNGEVQLAHDALCAFSTDEFEIEICETSYGTFKWELEVAAGWHDSILTLTRTGTAGEDLDIVYESAHRFHFNRSNEFILKPTCELPQELVHLFPKRICIKPVGDECEDCPPPAGTVQVDCCPDPLPIALQVQIFDSTGGAVVGECAAMEGQTIDIDYVGSIPFHKWTGTGTVCGESVTFNLVCLGGTFLWQTSGTSCFDDAISVGAFAGFDRVECPCAGCIVPTGPFEAVLNTAGGFPCPCCSGAGSYGFRVVPRT